MRPIQSIKEHSEANGARGNLKVVVVDRITGGHFQRAFECFENRKEAQQYVCTGKQRGQCVGGSTRALPGYRRSKNPIADSQAKAPSVLDAFVAGIARMVEPAATRCPNSTTALYSGPKITSILDPNLNVTDPLPSQKSVTGVFVANDAASDQSSNLLANNAPGGSLQRESVLFIIRRGGFVTCHQELAFLIGYVNNSPWHRGPVHVNIEDIQKDADARLAGT